jgi:Protein of unknown function (DUF1592)/Protein of unknown function (DUF1588)/Protein of unknown function (DUF1585)/Protein of unknown function (DUF1595)/Planctomycete cytochrome C/Protein of unknown function (DUF1587)
MRIPLCWLFLIVISQPAWLRADDYLTTIRPLLANYCFDCHGNDAEPEGGMNLERFQTMEQVLPQRTHWATVRDKVESGQMPPPKKKSQPTPAERQQILAWISTLAAAPDPVLGQRDPGKPVLRRLTRLEYNNTVRDLFGLRMDVFMFSERLPVGRDYFPFVIGFPRGPFVQVPVREYGTKYPVLLPDAGLPAGNRAEHGFANRGEAMNLSPVLFENYLTLARTIVESPKLPQQSHAFRWLINDPGVVFYETPPATEPPPSGIPPYSAVADFAPNLDLPQQAVKGGAVTVAYQFRFNAMASAQEGMGGVWAASPVRRGPDTLTSNRLEPGEGVHIEFGTGYLVKKRLILKSPQALWVAGFSTAEEVSGESLFTNSVEGEKVLDFTLKVDQGLSGEAVTDLALCVLSRDKEKGPVIITAQFSGGSTHSLEHDIVPGSGAGNTFYAFRAPEGEFITGFQVDGSQFSGNHVLLDDLGFITDAGRAPVKPPKVKRLSTKEKRKEAEARLSGFLSKAFRHPVGEESLARYLKIYDEGSVAGGSFAAGMKEAVAAGLASPEFLYLTSPKVSAAEGVRALDSWEVASRLSYFLWSAPPDEMLIEAAQEGTLAQQLPELVARMCQSPGAKELSESFGVQWLRLDQLYTARPDPDQFKSFYFGDRGKLTLHSAFLVEALLLFESTMVLNGSVLDFIDADYTWLNLRMARHYGLSDKVLPDAKALKLDITTRNDLKEARANTFWMRTKLPDKRRGGFLTMAGPLTVTSLPLRTSPVKRGAWLLETIFNRPPQEPKIAFVLNEDNAVEVKTNSVRQRFEQHRSRPECFSCHVRLDPPGFALEAFDPVGAWRTKDAGQDVDATAEWRGVAFNGPAEFKTQLMANPREFVRGFIEHLLSYALARKLELYDQPAVEEILAAAEKNGWKFRTIITGIVTSYPFLHTRTH